MTQSEEIIESLKPMFKVAREKKLWFHTAYQDLWFTPDELEQQHQKGKFVWGVNNWKLVKSDHRIKGIEVEIERLQKF